MKPDFYFDFKKHFRNSRGETISRLSSYDGVIEHIFQHFQNPKLLDIGSGFGEWVEKCSNSGINSIGLESNEKMISFCKQRGLNIISGNVLRSLKSFNSNSFSIISAFNFIEYLSYNEIHELLYQCKRLLMPDGVLILETPNIDKLQLETNTFHTSSGMINYITPESLVFIFELIGFDWVKYYLINGEAPNTSYMSNSITEVVFSTGKDVCFIAIANDISKNLFDQEEKWIEKFKLAKSTSDCTTSFDSELNSIIVSQQEALQAQSHKISILETNLEYIRMRQDRLFNNILAKIYRKLKLIIFGPFKIFKIFILHILHFTLRTILKYSKSGKAVFILKTLAKVLRALGFNEYSSRLTRKLNEANRTVKKSSTLNNKLIEHYNSSKIAQSIYEQIKSKKVK